MITMKTVRVCFHSYKLEISDDYYLNKLVINVVRLSEYGSLY